MYRLYNADWNIVCIDNTFDHDPTHHESGDHEWYVQSEIDEIL